MSDARPVELSVERSTSAQPFILRTYDTRSNGRKKIAYSETYKQKASAENAAAAIKAGSVTYATLRGADSKFYWHVKGRNGETMARSASSFGTEAAASTQMNWLKANAGTAIITDNT